MTVNRPEQWIQERVFPADRSSSPTDGQHFSQEREAFQLKVLQICNQCSICLLQECTENQIDHECKSVKQRFIIPALRNYCEWFQVYFLHYIVMYSDILVKVQLKEYNFKILILKYNGRVLSKTRPIYHLKISEDNNQLVSI